MNSSNIETVDVNDADFYNQLQEEIGFDMARLKKSVTIVKNLRRKS